MISENLVLNKTTRGFDLPQYRLNCTKCVKLIFRKINKIVVIRCHILKLKCTKFDFGWGSCAASGPLAGFKGPTSKARKGRKRDRGGRAHEGYREGQAGEGEWGSPTHYFRLKSCTAFNTSPKSALRGASLCAAVCDSILNQK